MCLTISQKAKTSASLVLVKNFLAWAFILTVCLLIVGFPLVILAVTVGALSSIILQSIMPISAVLLVSSSIIGFPVLAILVGAFVLTLKGVYPQDVSWLTWLHPKSVKAPVYAACPLTCEITNL
jgi:hypothetical protein